MEINIVKAIQDLSCGFLDVCFWIITKLGEETVFLLVLIGIYLLYNKRFAIRYSLFYLISVGINELVKFFIKRPRPYNSSNLIIDKLHATGYSFPSGHSQGYFVQASTLMIEINDKSKRKNCKISLLVTFIVVGLLVMLSRLYWGQHYLTDTIVGAMFGMTIAMFLDYCYRMLPEKIKRTISTDLFFKLLLPISLLLFVLFLLLELNFGFSSRKVYIFIALFLALSIGYFIDKKFIQYNEKSNFKITLLKAIILYSTVVLLYFLLDLLLDMKGYIYFLVYLFLGLVCTIILPLIFKKLFNKKEINNGNSYN